MEPASPSIIPKTMNFNEISSKIIKESISSAVYIDDKVLLPFEEERTGLRNQSELFRSFKKNNCYIDFNRFGDTSFAEIDTILNNKDLMILDWHLRSDENDLTQTFNILTSAVNTPSLHFSVIYTDQKKDFLPQNVILNIASFYSGLNRASIEEAHAKFDDLLDSLGLDNQESQSLKNKITSLTTELFFEHKDEVNKKEIMKLLDQCLNESIGKKDFIAFLNSLELPKENYTKQLLFLSYILNKCSAPMVADLKFVTTLSRDRYTIRVNNLYIKVFSKEVKDAELYNEFTESLTKESNIFLTLLGLEIRNRFRETSGFIGKELDDVNPLAFFYHRQNHFDGHEDLFNEFLKDIWKEQVASFLMEKNIELFNVIDEFKRANNIDGKLNGFKSTDESSRNSLAKLNLMYNRLAINRKENDEIRFGDIFRLDFERNNPIYLLCLTPHCDCLRPGKIKNMFYFVEGTDIGINKGIEKSDGDFISYMESDNKIICVDWTNGAEDCKPFSFYIENNRMAGESKAISFFFRGENVEAKYICTLKENYTQRIANKAFFYPLRVGIDFATFKND